MVVLPKWSWTLIVLIGMSLANPLGLERDSDQGNTDQQGEDTGSSSKSVFINSCSGEYQDTTDDRCIEKGDSGDYSNVCYWNEQAFEFFSCPEICNGVEYDSEAEKECTYYVECERYIEMYCKLVPKIKPTVATSKKPTTEPKDQTTAVPVGEKHSNTSNDRELESLSNKLIEVDVEQKIVESVNGDRQDTQGMQTWAIVLIAVAVIIMISAISLIIALCRKFGGGFPKSRRSTLVYERRGLLEVVVPEYEADAVARAEARRDAAPYAVVPSLRFLAASASSIPQLAKSVPDVTFTAEQPTIFPENMENVTLEDPQCTDTNDGDGGRVVTNVAKRKSCSF